MTIVSAVKMKDGFLKISLVIPLFNEEETLEKLVESINRQTFPPDEVILVDGGSTDKTVEVFERFCAHNSIYKLVKTNRASPGKGRNIGVENARNQWIAFTDAGIALDKNWLAELAKIVETDPKIEVVYGNSTPAINSFFDKIATFVYVAPLRKTGIRTRFIASSLIKKDVWQKVGGFPDLRAAEDLIFMEKIDEADFKTALAPAAMVFWQLRPTLRRTFEKFVLYSKHNVWINRQWDWHYGIARQYALMFPFVILAFLHNSWWLLVIAGWLFARTAKAILKHRYEFGWLPVFNPFIFFGTMFLISTIDLATIVGWIQAILYKKTDNFMETHA